MERAIAAAGIGTWCWEIGAGEIAWSPRCCELFGVREPPADFEAFLALVHPADRERCELAVRRCLEGEEMYDAEFRIGDPEKPPRWMASRGLVERGTSGVPIRMLGAIEDITARRQAEKERDELRLRLVKVQEQERLRLSRDLHDQVGQDLARVLLGVDALTAVVDEAARHRVAALRQDVERIGAALHRIAFELRPSALDDLGLRGAIDDLLADWSSRLCIPIDFVWDEELEEPQDDVSIALYRVLQEAITNVSKHAAARRVRVSVTRPDGGVRLTVEDDGRGFEPAAALAGAKLGLAGMRERLALIDGELAVMTRPGSGTVMSIHVPARIGR
jgi:two-component system, NarL family, sensor histidine kinase UhpB